MRARRAALAVAVAALLGALCEGGCAKGSARGGISASASTRHQIVREESRDVDAAPQRIPGAQRLVQSYHIEDERLSAVVDAGDWAQLGGAGQDAFKQAMWRAWADSYVHRNGPTHERIFFSVYDLAGNDLGSYFQM